METADRSLAIDEVLCGGGESRPTGTTASLDCGGGPAQVKTASEVSAPSKDGRALDGRRCNSAPEQSGLGSATCRNGGTAGVASGPHDTILADPTVAELLTKVGDQVRAAVANPPPPEVDLPVELPLRRPNLDADDLAFPDFLDRRQGRAA